jgi:hypothetical protein
VHYYAPREELISGVYSQLVGDSPEEGGHYITVWAPRQTGKSWIMLQVLRRLAATPQFDALKLDLEHLKGETDTGAIVAAIAEDILRELGHPSDVIDSLKKFQELFSRDVLDKPLILILDEFDALCEEAINQLTSIFRNIYNRRQSESNKPAADRRYRLHSVALIGVRSVLGIENAKGSPFNVQRSLHIPNLSAAEVTGMFRWYEQESGQKIEASVIDRVYEETQGQPGLTCWFGELLTETYNENRDKPITTANFEEAAAAAVKILPNNNILNIISKASQEPYKHMVLELFNTQRKIEFTYDNTRLNYLYMNGVIDREKESRTEYTVIFSCPFVQKRLFNYFANELFHHMGQLYEPFESIADTVTPTDLDIRNLVKRYQVYLKKNREWLLKDAPRRSDLRVYEAVFHFNFYTFLHNFLEDKGGQVYPEFPTGNGKIDIIIKYRDRVYALELKSYRDRPAYDRALSQAAQYGRQLGLQQVYLIFLVEYIDDTHRHTLETEYRPPEAGPRVTPIFIETDN